MFKKIYEYLKKEQLKITFAESCTGGLLSKLMTDIPGASEVFDGSIVSYSNDVKNKFLGVDDDVLKKYGAVSVECAKQMAEGARQALGADIAVSVTGLAGPGGESDEKPVGLVYIGVADCNATTVYKTLNERASREQVREMTAENIKKILEEKFGI